MSNEQDQNKLNFKIERNKTMNIENQTHNLQCDDYLND